MTKILPFQSLEENPRQHFAEFERQVYDDAGSVCTDIFRYGLLSLVVSDAVWATLPNNFTVADNELVIADRNFFAPPLQPADIATTGAWEAFESRRRMYDIYSTASLLLLRRIKLKLPASDKALLSHPILASPTSNIYRS